MTAHFFQQTTAQQTVILWRWFWVDCLLTTEIAECLNVSVTTVWRLARDLGVPTWRPGPRPVQIAARDWPPRKIPKSSYDVIRREVWREPRGAVRRVAERYGCSPQRIYQILASSD